MEHRRVKVPQRNCLQRPAVIGDPVGVLQIGGEQSVRVYPALQHGDIVGVERSRRFRSGGGKGPNLPFLVLIDEIGHAGVIGRPEGLLDRAVDQVFRTAGIEVVENDGAF